MKRITMLFAATALAISSANVAAFAQERRVVQYGELDLSIPAGRTVFLARLHKAAVGVCGTEPRWLESRTRKMHEVCVQDAMDRAIASLPDHVAAKLEAARIREAAIR